MSNALWNVVMWSMPARVARLFSDSNEVLHPMDQSNEVSNAAEAKDGSSVGNRAPPIGLGEVTNVISCHRCDITERLESLIAETGPAGNLVESDPHEDGIHERRWLVGHYQYWNVNDRVRFDVLFCNKQLQVSLVSISTQSVVRRGESHVSYGRMISPAFFFVSARTRQSSEYGCGPASV